MTRYATALLVGVVAFVLYHSTLLPGFDFGDTPSFQVMAGEPVITPRDGYPLYFGIGRLFVRSLGGDRAHALNVASAVEAALATGFIVLTATEIAGSLAAGAAVALLFSGSYTFWSQAVTAEVYALHIVFVALTVLLLFQWDKQPTLPRLAFFVMVYAVGFANHLSMILLAPAYTVFIVIRLGWRDALSGRVLTLACGCAIIGALPYVWNLRALWLAAVPPDALASGLRTFWFDVTKADWRNSMVMNVPSGMAAERARMYLFDVKQQFGWVGPALSVIGLWHLARARWCRALALAMVFAATLVFALSYNVGDTHVFLLPSHLVLALLAASGIVALGGLLPNLPNQRVSWTVLVAITLGGFTSLRIYRDFPALDRSGDQRAMDLLNQLTSDLDDRRAVLVTDLDWQVENGLNYFVRNVRPDVASTRMNAVLLYAPQFVRDNEAIGRRIVANERAAQTLETAYGPLFSIAPDDGDRSTDLNAMLDELPRGTRYAFCVLPAQRGMTLDPSTISDAVQHLSGGRLSEMPDGIYSVIAGAAGESVTIAKGANRPFTVDGLVDGLPVTVRMDSWLAFDTIRRMGFGHVIAGRQHSLIVERGVSFVAFDAQGRPVQKAYVGSIFEHLPRFQVTSSSVSRSPF